MSTAADRLHPHVNPRPGVVRTLGILNILIAVLMLLGALTSVPFLIAVASIKHEPKVVVAPTPGPTTKAEGSAPIPVPTSPLMGLEEAEYVKFVYMDMTTSLIMNSLMLATGVGLINLKRWGAVWWTRLAWLKIVRLFVLGGYFIVVVGPALSVSMARTVAPQIQATQRPGQAPILPILARTYGVMFLILGVCMILFGSIYPAISLWILRKAGVQAALVVETPTEEAIEP